MLAIQFAILGLGLGAGYALLGQGIVAVYRGSGILNFSQGAVLMVTAFVFAKLYVDHGLPLWVGALGAVITAIIIGAAIQLLVMHPLRNASSLSKVVATLGIMLSVEGGAQVLWGSTTEVVPDFYPAKTYQFGSLYVPSQALIMIGVVLVMTGALWLMYRFSLIGIATSGVAENRRAAAALGWSPDVVGTVNWIIGSVLAAIGGILVSPLGGIQVATTTELVIPALATALIGSFTSFPRTLAGALAIGIGQAEIGHYLPLQGLDQALPLIVIVAFLTFGGKSLPVRGFVSDRFAVLGSGRVRPIPVLVLSAVLVGLLLTVFPVGLDAAIGVSLGFGIVMLSVVVLTGYTGQLSLAQLTFAGGGALIAGLLVANEHWPFELAILAGVLGIIPAGLVIAIPTLRIRGVNLAVATLAVGLGVQDVIFSSAAIAGGGSTGTSADTGIMVGPQRFLGISIDPLSHPGRYAVMVFGFLLVCMLVVASMRRGRVGRRLIAVRTNERAAAALGVSVFEAKIYAFVVASAIAALGGILLAFQQYSVVFGPFDVIASITLVAFAVIGGIGFAIGPLFGSVLAAGGLGAYIFSLFFTGIDQWLTLIGGLGLLGMLMQDPNGLARVNIEMARKNMALIRAMLPHRPAATAAAPAAARELAYPAEDRARLARVAAKTLEVAHLTVRFGGVVAVSDLSLSVVPGQIRGLIGPNGAGKTTVIDAITGFVRPATGTITLDGRAMNGLSVTRRSRAGLSRSFQSLELFEDLTLFENLQAASDRRDQLAYLTNLAVASNQPLPSAAVAAIDEFGLAQFIDSKPSELPYGGRRLAAVARAVATRPSILLLDEPAAGLDEQESAEFAKLVRRLADHWGMGILLVEHDMSFVMSVCDRVTVMDFGRQIAEGTASQIRSDPGVIAAYLGEPADEGSSPQAKTEEPMWSR